MWFLPPYWLTGCSLFRLAASPVSLVENLKVLFQDPYTCCVFVSLRICCWISALRPDSDHVCVQLRHTPEHRQRDHVTASICPDSLCSGADDPNVPSMTPVLQKKQTKLDRTRTNQTELDRTIKN